MNKLSICLFAFLLFLLLAYPTLTANDHSEKPAEDLTSEINKNAEYRRLYDEMQLNNIVSYKAFEQAMEGYKKIHPKKEILTLIDYSKPSTEERLYIFDLKQKKKLYTSVVAHGKNSGENYATSFSNKSGSLQSSLGFFLTEGTYQGRNGYSLILNGLEKNINCKAKSRAIVMHGADYCSASMAKKAKRLGRSWGCPAIPRNVNKEIIDAIKGGSLMYIFADDEDYLKQSSIL